MSNSKPEGSLRQLPPGKLSSIKKIFEDGDNASQEKAEKPTAAIRTPELTNRVRSPIRQPAIKKYPAPSVPGQQKPQSSAQPVVQAGDDTRKTDQAQPKDSHKPSPAISDRISSYLGNVASKNDVSGGTEKTTAVPPPKPMLRQKISHSSTEYNSGISNPLYCVSNDKVQPTKEVSDLYAKVNKPSKNVESSPRKVSFLEETNQWQRREAVKKNSEERRKTVASIETELGNMSPRLKFGDAQRADKPAPPLKPDSVRRQYSMRTTREYEQQLEKQHEQRNRSDSDSQQESVYSPPWDTTKSKVLENLKKFQPPAHLPSKLDNQIPPKSASPPPKPPLPNQTPKKMDTQAPKPSHEDAANEISASSTPGKVKPADEASEPAAKAGPPPKPPRTHAHDDYLKVKVTESRGRKVSISDSGGVKSQVVIESDVTANGTPAELESVSVKDRISKMQQQTESGPPPLPSVAFSNASKDQNAVTRRHQPPSRPPPPKRRPNSGGSPVTVQTTPQTIPRPFTQQLSHEGPVIIPISPNRQNFSDESHPRSPTDQLPLEPGQSNSLTRFPLRKSYSSECLHSSQGSLLDVEDTENGRDMAKSFYDYEYEAVLDPDGYAIPHEFMKLPGKQKFSTQNTGKDTSSKKLLTLLRPNKDSSQNESQVTTAQDQILDKVTKKKMMMVKQKINQAYADVSLNIKCAVETPGQEDWVHVERDTGGTDTEEAVVEPTEIKKRVDYCSSVRLKSTKSIKKSKEYLDAIYPQLFEYCLIVGLQPMKDSSGFEPYVMHKFPENVSSNLSVPSFCFPDASIFKVGSVTSLSESYSFVMTHADGSRVFGYCRRIQPSDVSLPEVICIISPIDAFNMYNTLLSEIEKRRRISSDLAHELIAASFGRPLPKPGKICHIRTLDSNSDMETIFLSRPSDHRLENVNYESPLYYLGTDKLVKVFSSIVMERRVLLCSSNLSVLTQTVHALAALLYPFHWQHVYVPLLPPEMLDVVCAPMPYILGVLSAFLPQVLKMDVEEVFIVDLDKKSIVKSQGDESTILPRKVQRALKTAINMCKIDSEAQNAQWLMVAEAFIRMFIETIGHFNNHLKTQQDGNRIFQKENFIIEVVSKEVRQFLEWFTETQMFEMFVEQHIEKTDAGTSGLFMQRLIEYKESKEETIKHKGLGAKVKHLGKALKTKLS
ncbi:DENN domain-containing protein 2A-like isoform X2 [Physella acuta]|uniref:DENN domain-containing protein 2A-like isoform X2 n=1 Tax=Physella acuta TaxID=109671 RepID=UPI0027DB1D8E|nr:DENN domain-containing protein 2A-like isoform X2 [Physella acuta]